MSKIKFFFLTSAGILVTACQGFDGVVTMLSVFAMSPSILLGIGFAFILLSVIVFFGVDLVKVSNALGVKLSEYKLLDAYLLQLQRIKAIRKKINDYTLVAMSQEDLQQLELVLSMLHKRLKFLAVASKQFEEALNNKNVQMIKTVISGVSALFFFGGGFFAGQSVALFISSLVLDSALPTFWPVIVFSALVGLAALSIYWYVERPELEKLVTNWFGLNEEKVQQLCDKSSVDKEANKLTSVKEKVISTARLIKRLAQLEHGNSRDEQTLASNTTQNKAVADLRVSSNFYSFLKLSVSAIPRENQDLHEIMFCGVK
ncbi:putative lipoprotein [Legionella longbeachae D-4968]|nr:putative lipoprotein [Legionella longbeachae D-4968]